jgi:WD40 repeat protein
MALTPPLRHAGTLLAATIGPGGKDLVTVGTNGTLCVWELPHPPEEGDILPPEGVAGASRIGPPDAGGKPFILGQGRSIRYTVFSPDGSRLATVAEDGTARVWDAETGDALTPVLRLSGPITRAFFLPDGDRLIAVGEGGRGRAWDLAPDNRPAGDLVELARVLACGRIDDMEERKELNRMDLRAAWERMAAGR